MASAGERRTQILVAVHYERAFVHAAAVPGFEQLGQTLDFCVSTEFVHQQPLAVVGKDELEVTAALEQRCNGPHCVNGTAGAGHTDGDLRTHERRGDHKNTSAAVVTKYSRPTQPLRSNANFTCDRSSARTSDCS